MIKSIRIAIADDNPLRWVSVQSSVAREGRSRIDRPRLLEGDHVFLRWFTDQARQVTGSGSNSKSDFR